MKCQEIKLHGTLTTKEIKKHLSRLVGGVEMGSQAEGMHSKAVDCWEEAGAGGLVLPYSHADMPEGKSGE